MHEGHAALAQEAVELERPAHVVVVDRHQHVELDPLRPQQIERRHDPARGWLPAPVAPMLVMQAGRAVDAEAEQKIMLAQEPRPLHGQQGAIGL
ncbi:hypothetical protein D3C86_1593390 [compost metagenome]